MSISYQPDVDIPISEMSHCNIYCKDMEQRVYVVRPTASQPKATILLIHGLCEHPFRYFPLASDLASEGHQTILFDLKGHGLSFEEVKPYFKLIKEYAKTLDPAELANTILTEIANSVDYAKVRKENINRLKKIEMEDHLAQINNIINALILPEVDMPDFHFFMAGHSLGGLIASEATWRLGKYGPIQPEGVILLSPALKTIAPPDSNFLTRAFLSISWESHQNIWLTPFRWLVKLLIIFGVKQDVSWSSNWISDIPAEKHLQCVDPLILRELPLGYLVSIEKQMVSTLPKGVDYPVDAIFFIPLDDQIVNPKGNVAFAKIVCNSRGRDSSMTTYNDFWCHELHRSTKRGEVLDLICAWLNNKIIGSQNK